MAKKENFSSVIKVVGSADFSDIVSNLNKLYSTIEGKADRTDIINIEKSISKIKELQSEIQKMKDKGLTNEKEVSQYNKNIETLLKTADQLNSKFSSVKLTGLEESIKDAKDQIKYLQDEMKSAIKTAQTLVRAQVSSTKKGYKENLLSAIDERDEAKRLEYEQKITQELQKQTEEAKQRLDIAKENLKAAQVRQQNLQNQRNKGFSLSDFNINRGAFRRDNKIVGNEAFNTADKIFNSIINSSKDATVAVQKFYKEIAKPDNGNLSVLASVKDTMEQVFNTAIERKRDLDKSIEESKKAVTSAGRIVGDDTKGAVKTYNTARSAQKSTSEFLQSTEYVNAIKNITNSEYDLAAATRDADQAQANLNNTQSALISGTASLGNSISRVREEQSRNVEETNKVAAAQRNYDNEIERIKYHVKYLLSITNAWRQIRSIVTQTFSDVSKLDKAFAEIAMVTNYSVADMWSQYSNYAEMANRLGQSTESVIQASGLYYQQGLDTADALKLTEDTMKLATLAGLDFKDATSQMTAALRAFKMEMDEGFHVTDVYAEVAANAAVDVQGLSDAMSATAAIAHSSGMTFETTTAMLATMVEATQEAPSI